MYRAVYNTRSVNIGLIKLLEDFSKKYNLNLPIQTNLLTSNDRISFSKWISLLNYVERNYLSQNLSLKLAELVEPEHLGILGYICKSSEDIGEAIQAFLKYHRLAYDSIDIYATKNEEEFVIRWRSETNFKASRVAVETMMSTLVSFIRKLISPEDLTINKINFITESPKDTKVYSDFFRCPIYFKQRKTAIYFPINFMRIKISTHDEGLNHFLTRYADILLNELPEKDSFEIIVKNEIIYSILQGDTLIENVAEKLGYSPRMFQYLLKQAGLNFKTLLTDLRRDLAIKYLSDPSLTILEVSHLLSYQEQTSFIRAFKLWTGLSPSQYRRKFLTDFKEELNSDWDILS